jgi:hypothetical protein
MPEIKTPENLDAVREIKPSQKVDPTSITNNLLAEINKADAARQEKRDNWERWYKKRMGMRPPKNFPWVGCSNIHIPFVDKVVKKVVPLYTSLVEVAGKMAVFVPSPTSPALIKVKGKAESFFTFLTKAVMNSHPEALGFFESIALGTDKKAEKGYVVYKTVWSTVTRRRTKIIDVDRDLGKNINRRDTPSESIEQALLRQFNLDPEDEADRKSIDRFIADFKVGKDFIPIRFSEKVYDAPQVIARDPQHIITPTDTTNFASARWIDDWFWSTSNDLRRAVRMKKYRKDHVEAFLEHARNKKTEKNRGLTTNQGDVHANRTSLDSLKDRREGVSTVDLNFLDDVHKLHEVGVHFDINGDGIEEKCIITFPDARPDLWFRFIELPYDHGEWPWTEDPFELIDERATASRGIPEHLDHLQTVITSRHNFKLDSMTLMNAPILKTVTGQVNLGNFGFKPGDKIPVTRPDAVEPLTWDRSGLLFEEKEEAILKSWGEEYVGLMIDQLLQSTLNPTQEARTKFEIQSGVTERSRIFGHNARLFLKRIRRIYEQIWSLWMQYGDPQLEIFVNGEPMQIRKQEFARGKFYIFPAASPESASPQLEAQNALQDIAIFKGDPLINQVELRNRYFKHRDPMNFEQMVIEPRQLQATQVERQVLELTQMELGFDVSIKADDDDKAHLAVIQKYLGDVQQGKRRVSPEVIQRVSSHGEFHRARALQLAGQSGAAEKARTRANQVRGLPE